MTKHTVRLMPAFYIVLALGFVMIPIRWFAAWIIAAAVHEISHIAMLRICGCRVLSVTVGFGGAVIEADCQSEIKKLICTAAGPLSGALLLLWLRFMPRVAVCALLQSVYNLLPFTTLDGGKILQTVISMMFPEKKAGGILQGIQLVLILIMIFLAVYAAVFLHLGWIPCLMVLVLLIKNKNSLANIGIWEYNKWDKIIRGYKDGRKTQQNFTHGTKACKIHRR